MILFEGNRSEAEEVAETSGLSLATPELSVDGPASALAKERIDWLSGHEDLDVLINAPMLSPLRDSFYEHSIVEMMLMVRGCSYYQHDDWPVRTILPPSTFDKPSSRDLAMRYREAFPSMPGIGSLYPHTVLVGEQPNPRTLEYTGGVPFSVGPSGAWLMATLGCIDVRPSTYITNAVKHDGDSRMVAREIRWLQPTAVVALGTVASAALSRAKIAHSLVWHPQYARRFHFKEQHEYVEQIRQAIHLATTERYCYA